MAGQESRHAFQNSMVDALGSALQSIHTKQEAAVAEAQKGLEDLVARQAGGSRAVWMAARSSTLSSSRALRPRWRRAVWRTRPRRLVRVPRGAWPVRSRWRMPWRPRRRRRRSAWPRPRCLASKGVVAGWCEENVEALGREKTAVLKEQEGFEKASQGRVSMLWGWD